MSFFKLIILIVSLSSITLLAEEKKNLEKSDKEPSYCIQVYTPVCGQYDDGKKKTFSNSCFMDQAGAKKISDGECGVNKILKEKPLQKESIPSPNKTSNNKKDPNKNQTDDQSQ